MNTVKHTPDELDAAKAALVPGLTQRCLRIEVENRGLRTALGRIHRALIRLDDDVQDALRDADATAEGFAGEATHPVASDPNDPAPGLAVEP